MVLVNWQTKKIVKMLEIRANKKKKSKNAGNSLVEQETKLLASYFLKISEKYQNLLRRYRVRVYNSRKLL